MTSDQAPAAHVDSLCPVDGGGLRLEEEIFVLINDVKIKIIFIRSFVIVIIISSEE